MKSKKNVYTLGIGILCVLIILISAIIISTANNKNDIDATNSENSIRHESSEVISSVPDTESLDSSGAFAESNNSDLTDVFDASESDNAILHGWVINNLGYTYFYDNSGYEQFNYKNTALERYVNSLNGLASAMPSNTKIYNITVPVSGSFADIPRDVYVNDNFYNASQSAFVSTVGAKIDQRIINVPIVTVLEEQYDNGEIVFFRTDKNWTSLGAYFAYREFCISAGLQPYELADFNSTEIGDYLGSFYNAIALSGNADDTEFANILSKSPDNMLVYSTVDDVKTSLTVYSSGLIYDNYRLCDNAVSVNNAYNVFFGMDAERYEVNTTASGGQLLIIGDSSAYPLVPFLASHYRKIDIINPSKYNSTLNEFLSQRSYDACLTMCYSTNAVSGEYVPKFNIITGVNQNE